MARQLTEEFAKKAPAPQSGQTFHFDSKLAGFALRISPRVRAWTMQLYRQGKSQRVTLGLVGEVSLADAKTQAMALKAKGLKNTRGQPRTIADLWDRLVAEDERRLRQQTKRIYDSYWRNHIEPAIGPTKLTKVTLSDVSQMLAKIPGNVHANRVHELTKRLFGYAVDHKWLSDNPAAKWSRRHEEQREVYLEHVQLVKLFDALPANEVGDTLRFAALTGPRIGEVLAMKRTELRDNGSTWLKPPRSTKQKKPHLVPLIAAARVIVERQLARGIDSEFVFARKDGRPIRSARKTWIFALKRAGLPSDIHTHDLRHTLASLLINDGATLALVGRALGHSTPATTQRYAHLASDVLRSALENTAGKVIQLPVKRSA